MNNLLNKLSALAKQQLRIADRDSDREQRMEAIGELNVINQVREKWEEMYPDFINNRTILSGLYEDRIIKGRYRASFDLSFEGLLTSCSSNCIRTIAEWSKFTGIKEESLINLIKK